MHKERNYCLKTIIPNEAMMIVNNCMQDEDIIGWLPARFLLDRWVLRMKFDELLEDHHDDEVNYLDLG